MPGTLVVYSPASATVLLAIGPTSEEEEKPGWKWHEAQGLS